jgi:itaconate CoA-transferase
MDVEIASVFNDLPAEDVRRRLDAAQIANAGLNTVEQFIDHPQLAARNAWREVASPVGPIRALVPPVRMEDVEPVMGAIPAVGEHRESILAELGFDAGTIERWKQEGMI